MTINKGAFCAVICLAAAIASPAEARNRTTEMMISDMAERAGVSYQTAFERADTQLGEDLDLYPGIIESSGGFSYSYGGQAVTLIGVRLYNENNFALCVRAKGALVGGPMAGSRQGGSIGYNFLIEPRSSESVIAHTANRAYSVMNTGQYATEYYLWPAAPASVERRCSSIAPADLESWAQAPLRAAPGQSLSRATPDLLMRLGL
jgi:hypothetical protein